MTDEEFDVSDADNKEWEKYYDTLSAYMEPSDTQIEIAYLAGLARGKELGREEVWDACPEPIPCGGEGWRRGG